MCYDTRSQNSHQTCHYLSCKTTSLFYCLVFILKSKWNQYCLLCNDSSRLHGGISGLQPGSCDLSIINLHIHFSLLFFSHTPLPWILFFPLTALWNVINLKRWLKSTNELEKVAFYSIITSFPLKHFTFLIRPACTFLCTFLMLCTSCCKDCDKGALFMLFTGF